jgi:hypothetical protein
MKLRIRGNPNLYDATLLVHDSDCEDLGWPAAIRISWGDGEQVFAAPDVAIRNCKLAWATPEEWRSLAEYGFLPDNTPK